MSLTGENPSHFKPGVSANPNGRPKGAKTKAKSDDIETRLKSKHKVHAADKLVEMAHYFETNNKMEEAAKIWMALLKFYKAPRKNAAVKDEEDDKTPKPLTPEQAAKLLKEFENNGSKSTESGKGAGMANGAVVVPPQTSPETDL